MSKCFRGYRMITCFHFHKYMFLIIHTISYKYTQLTLILFKSGDGNAPANRT